MGSGGILSKVFVSHDEAGELELVLDEEELVETGPAAEPLLADGRFSTTELVAAAAAAVAAFGAALRTSAERAAACKLEPLGNALAADRLHAPRRTPLSWAWPLLGLVLPPASVAVTLPNCLSHHRQGHPLVMRSAASVPAVRCAPWASLFHGVA